MNGLWWAVALLVPVGVFGVFLAWRLAFFLRDPHREIPAGEERIVAAADGYVVYVKRVDGGEVPIAVKGRRSIPLEEFAGVGGAAGGYLIGTYMTEYSVHRNRAPIAGTVTLRLHVPAMPINVSMARMTARLLLSQTPYDADSGHLLTNERLTIALRHDSGAVVLVTQIADRWINRIVARVGVGDRLARGQQYGLIRFGSQCDVFLPDSLVGDVLVVPGQYVWAGRTILARAV